MRSPSMILFIFVQFFQIRGLHIIIFTFYSILHFQLPENSFSTLQSCLYNAVRVLGSSVSNFIIFLIFCQKFRRQFRFYQTFLGVKSKCIIVFTTFSSVQSHFLTPFPRIRKGIEAYQLLFTVTNRWQLRYFTWHASPWNLLVFQFLLNRSILHDCSHHTFLFPFHIRKKANQHQ